MIIRQGDITGFDDAEVCDIIPLREGLHMSKCSGNDCPFMGIKECDLKHSECPYYTENEVEDSEKEYRRRQNNTR